LRRVDLALNAPRHTRKRLEAMTNEELQVLNDVVKVGFPVVGTLLGGVLGGVSTYFVTKLNHKNERTKEITKKRLDLVLQAANDVAEFEHLIGTYATAISNHVQELEGAIDMEAARHALINRNQPLRRARMTLKLLWLRAAEEELEAYVEVTREIVAKGPNLKMPRVSELAKIVTRGPVKFYAALASEFPSK
jgi:uncharacterized protein (DUF4213/DUF364 family)